MTPTPATPPTETLAAWLEAAIAETEAVARAAVATEPYDGSDAVAEVLRQIRQSHGKVTLRRCEADRQILALHWSYVDDHHDRPAREVCDCGQDTPCPTLRALASAYAGEPGWQEVAG